jgi:hypothetical protein
MRTSAKHTAAAVLAVSMLLLLPTLASAHGHAGVGDLEMTIGFAVEPAYAGQPNGVQLELVHDGHPVTDLDDTLQVEVSFGDETSEPMTLEPWFEVGEWGTPGEYRANFTPSQPGDYTFHFTGTVDGEEIDETMSSSPKTFASVQDIAASEFPQVDAPSAAELADRIEQESTRAADGVAQAQAAVTEANDAAAAANDAASSAKTMGIIGIIVGAIGLIVGGIALSASRKTA